MPQNCRERSFLGVERMDTNRLSHADRTVQSARPPSADPMPPLSGQQSQNTTQERPVTLFPNKCLKARCRPV
jgi:hypothetical protein